MEKTNCFKRRIPTWLRCTMIAALAILLILGTIGVIQHIQDHQVLDVQYTGSRPHAFSDSFASEPEDLVKSSNLIYEGIVIDISFDAQQDGYLPNYYLDTIYTVLVTRTYKGHTQLIENIHVSDGLRDYKLKEQLEALQEAGAPESYRSINVHNGGMQPKIGSTYLFCVRDPDHLPDHWASCYSQFALSGNLAVPWYDKYNPDVIKEYLPYVPHPLFIAAIIGTALVTVILFIRKRKKTAKEEFCWKTPKS